jgi:hypothetical protein
MSGEQAAAAGTLDAPPLRLKQPVQHLLECAVHYPAKTPSAHQSRSLFDLYIEPVDYSTD